MSAARPVVCECCGASPHVGPCASVGLELLPGDCVFFQSDGFVAWAIRQVERWHLWRRCALFFTGRFRKAFGELEGRSYVNHVAMVVKGGSLMTALIMDAQPPIVRTQRLGMYTGDLIAVYRPNGIDDEKRQAMAKRAAVRRPAVRGQQDPPSPLRAAGPLAVRPLADVRVDLRRAGGRGRDPHQQGERRFGCA